MSFNSQDIFRCWIKEHPVKMTNIKEGSPSWAIIAKEPKINVSFDIREDSNPKSRKTGLKRWQQNPERDWGPKPRAKKGGVETLDDRRQKGRQKNAKRKANTQVAILHTCKPEVIFLSLFLRFIKITLAGCHGI